MYASGGHLRQRKLGKSLKPNEKDPINNKGKRARHSATK
jgi:hypothetical protein